MAPLVSLTVCHSISSKLMELKDLMSVYFFSIEYNRTFPSVSSY